MRNRLAAAHREVRLEHAASAASDGLAKAVELLVAAGCGRLWLNGSFVTAKEEPADFDACWDPDGVDLDVLDPIFTELGEGRRLKRLDSAVSFSQV